MTPPATQVTWDKDKDHSVARSDSCPGLDNTDSMYFYIISIKKKNLSFYSFFYTHPFNSTHPSLAPSVIRQI